MFFAFLIRFFDGKILSCQLQSLYIFLLHLHRRMHISIQRNTGISVSQQFTQRLCIKPMGNTICSISVSKQMKWNLPDTTEFQDFLKPILHRSRFCRFAFPSNQVQKILSFFLFQQCQQEGRNRNCPHRSSAFGRADQYLGTAVSIALCTVRFTESVPFSKSISFHCKPHNSPMRKPVNKHSRIARSMVNSV